MKNNNEILFEKLEPITFRGELKFKYESSINRKFCRKKRKIFNNYPERKQMVVFADDYVSDEVLSCGVYEKPQLELILEWLKTKKDIFNSTVLDVGANIGNHSLYFSNYFSKCISFEPNPRTFSVLEINCRLTNNIIPINLGLSDKKCTAPLYTSFQNVGGSSLSNGWNAEVDSTCNIQLDRVDDIVDIGEKIGLIKMDVEGHEWFALKGAETLIKNNKPVIIFEHNATEDNNDMDVIGLLDGYGYDEFYEVIDGREELRNYLDRFPRWLHFLVKIFLIFRGKKISYRIARIDYFNKKQYPIIIAQIS